MTKLRLRTFVCACVTVLLTTISQASATTISLEDGPSETSFSIIPGHNDALTVSPVITISTNGCPGIHCSNSFWNVGITIDFFDTADDLIAADPATVSEDCIPGNCTVPTSASFLIPASATSFEIFNTVNVGGGWSYNSGSEFIIAGNSDIAETPIPASFLLFFAGLAMFSLLALGRKDRQICVVYRVMK